MVFNQDTPMDWVQRPPQLANVRDAFAVFMVGDSMSPAYDPGDIIFIHPSMSVKPGRAALIELHDGSALVKILIKQTEAYVRVAEYNPEPRQFEIDRREIKAMFRVTGRWDGA
jgi:phage repressor protein C with HTH and peptisase S24 domain